MIKKNEKTEGSCCSHDMPISICTKQQNMSKLNEEKKRLLGLYHTIY